MTEGKRYIEASAVRETVESLCVKAAYELPADVYTAIVNGEKAEKSPLGKSVFRRLKENADTAAKGAYPVCQDTGLTVVFIELGNDVCIQGATLDAAVNEGVRRGYEKGYLRKSIVDDPLYERTNTKDNTPSVIHLRRVPGTGCRITVVPKGGGSENMSRMTMLKPADGESGVIGFVAETVRLGGANPCPPLVIGIGIGGNFETVPLLAKEALLRPIGKSSPDSRYAALEGKILKAVNNTGIGPGGFGGTVTALAVAVKTAPCHIASLPVAVNVNCHAARHAEALL